MFNRTNLLIVLVAIAGAALGLVAGSRLGMPPERAVPAGVTVLKPGDTRADLAFPDPDGKPHRLSDWNGKLVLLNFWATWCGPCRDEMPLLDHAGAKLANTGLTVVGVAIDDAAAVKQFLQDNPVRYPILVDENAAPDPSLIFGDTRNVLPYSVLIGRDGKILAQRVGSFTSSTLNDWLAPHIKPSG